MANHLRKHPVRHGWNFSRPSAASRCLYPGKWPVEVPLLQLDRSGM
jgi:hypothetical protein